MARDIVISFVNKVHFAYYNFQNFYPEKLFKTFKQEKKKENMIFFKELGDEFGC